MRAIERGGSVQDIDERRRAIDFGTFIMAACLRLATLRRRDAIVALTSPPLISFIGACLAGWRGSKFVCWVMDLNPDEAVAAGWLKKTAPLTRLLLALLATAFLLGQLAYVTSGGFYEVGDPTLTVGLSVTAIALKIESGEMAEVLRWSQTAIDLADGDPTKGNFIIGSPLAVAFASLVPLTWWTLGLLIFVAITLGQILRLRSNLVEVAIP